MRGNWSCRSSGRELRRHGRARTAGRRHRRRHRHQHPSRSSAPRWPKCWPRETGIPFVEAVNHFEANANRDGLVECSGDLRAIAVTLFSVANNIRWLGSGPRCGFYEIMLPDRQPGSSIMPGKVNPVMCESMMQVCARVIGNDQTVAFSGATGGNFELNIMMPVMGHDGAGKLPAAGQRDAGVRRLLRPGDGSQPRGLRGGGRKEPGDGHEPQPAHRLRAGRGAGQGSVQDRQDDSRSLCQEQKILPDKVLDEALDPRRMTEPH